MYISGSNPGSASRPLRVCPHSTQLGPVNTQDMTFPLLPLSCQNYHRCKEDHRLGWGAQRVYAR